MNRLLKIIAFCGILPSLPAFSQEVPHTINFSKTSEKALDKTWMIAQDTNHYMYFGNNEGLITYDGSKWQTYSLPNKQIVRSVAIDQRGNIFTGAYGEFGYWDRAPSSQLTYHSLSDSVNYPLAHSEEIWNIVAKKDYVLLQSFSTIYKYDYQNISVIKPPEGQTIMFIHSVNGREFLQVKEKGIFEILPNEKMEFLPGTELLANWEVVSILPHGDSSIMIGTSLNGLFIWNNNTLKSWNTNTNQLFSKHQLNKGIKLSTGGYAFGTILNGIYILEENGNLKWNLNREKGLQNNTILSIWEGNQGGLWLGLDRGIDLIELNSSLIQFPDFGGFLGTVYSATLYKGHLFVGTNHGVFKRSWENNSQSNVPFTFVEGSQGQVWDLTVVDDQLLCGHNDGTFSIHNGNWKKISLITGGWMMIRHPGYSNILIQGTYTGIAIFKKDQTDAWQFSHKLSGLGDPIQKIAFDKDGFLWALNPYKGLYRLKIDNQQTQVLDLKRIGSKEGLPTEFDLDISQIGQEVLIRSDNRFFTFDNLAETLLPADSILGQSLETGNYSIIKGANHEWFKVSNGMIELIKKNEIEKITASLVSSFTNITPLDSQTYLLGLNSGYALYKKGRKETPEKRHEINPIITQVCLVGEMKNTFCIGPHTSSKEIIQLNHDQNYLRFSFTYPDYTTRSHFRYQLEGFSGTLSKWGNEHFKEYSNLKPGDYTFRVQSQLSSNFATFSFTILPAWYETIWAKILWGILIISSIIILGKYQAHRIEIARRKKEKRKQEELERQLIEARNEKLQLEILGKSQELANSTMSLVRKNEIFLELKNELKKIGAEFEQRLPLKYYRRILRLIDGNITNEYDWQIFETNFNQVHDQFFKRLKSDYKELTPGDLQLAAFLRMNLSSKEIAPLLNISLRGIENKRYRLRKKMGLKPEENLTEFLIKY